MHSANLVRAEAAQRFETSERTPMGTMPISVIWAGTQYPLKGQGELNACKEKIKVVKPCIWRTPPLMLRLVSGPSAQSLSVKVFSTAAPPNGTISC